MTNLIDFTGKRVVVIGASSGIGKQTAITLSEIGAQLILVARREKMLKEVCDNLEGEGHIFYTVDISNTDNIAPLFKRIKEEQGIIDGLVYSAGVNTLIPLMQLKESKLQETFAINFFAFVETVRQASRRGRYSEGMRIVAVSSNAASRGDKAHTAYSASKAAMNAAVRCMAKELADKKIYINAVAPAITNTELYRAYATDNEGISRSEGSLIERQYLGIIEPKDVAETIAYLLSPSARMITGITLPVDGGLSTT